jgi:myo-inositol-1(or 4)-monophosphatase
LQALLNIAVRAARAAGSMIVRNAQHVDGIKINAKGVNDFVTAIDRKSERIIIDTIRRSYPAHGILAEESGEHGGDDFVWIIDPLDGTTNFLHGFPQFAISIAVQRHGRIEHGLVFDPLRQELFTASRGSGAQLNERRIRVSNRKSLKGALLGTGFPFGELDRLDTYLATFRALSVDTAGIRRAGAAALDLAYVAVGRLDGFWEFGLRKWDIAAGGLLVQEAGGLLSAPNGGDTWFESGNIVAGPPKVLAAMLRAIKPHLTAALSR